MKRYRLPFVQMCVFNTIKMKLIWLFEQKFILRTFIHNNNNEPCFVYFPLTIITNTNLIEWYYA